MKILHIINSLKKGGAEGNLYRLCKFQKKIYKNKIEIIIITLIDRGYYEHELKKAGIKVISLKLNNYRLFNLLKSILYLRKLIKNENPDIVQSWMYHSNFITLFIPKIFYKKLYWNIRHSELNIKISKKMTIAISFMCGFFSNFIPKYIIYCSERSIEFHIKNHFYCNKKVKLINNGYSKNEYYPSNNLNLKFRKENKFNRSDIVLGFAGRYARQKNIPSLLVAFSKLIKKYTNLYLVMVGRNIDSNNFELKELIDKLNVNKKVLFLSEQKNLLKFYNGIDLLVLTSHSESFPNVVAESMLCSTPVLSSNAGCAKKIISDCGFVMTKNDHNEIFKYLKKSLNILKNKKKKWKILKKKSRFKINKFYSMEIMSKKYIKNWKSE